MKKQQFILLASGLALLLVLFFFGKTIPDKKKESLAKAANETSHPENSTAALTTADLLSKAKTKLTPGQSDKIMQLENSVVRGDVKDQQIAVYKQLTTFWGDTMHNHLLGAYYIGEAAKLESSEKNLIFAARLLLDNLLSEEDPSLQNWEATNAKTLFEKSLELNPANDSSKIGIGACYMFGNIADNPMQGIMMIRQVVEKDPNNLYGQMMLGLGGIRSGQYDKAIERFTIVVQKDPSNIEAVFHLAETYDRKGDKQNAIKWYKVAGTMTDMPEAKKAIDERIKTLQ